MIINDYQYGRLGNRLFLFAHLIAYAYATGRPVWNWAFEAYAEDFAAWQGKKQILVDPLGVAGRTRPKWVYRLGRTLRAIPVVRYHEPSDWHFDRPEGAAWNRKLEQSKLAFLEAWQFRGFEAIARYRAQVKALLQPKFDYEAWAEEQKSQLKADAEFLIGLHVRWEDYRGTPWFFELDQFEELAANLAKVFLPRSVKFVVFSNETLPQAAFSGMKVHLSGGSPLQDLMLMSRCDFLAGPPSTFSGWASFWGEVPLYQMKKGCLDPQLEDFSVVRG